MRGYHVLAILQRTIHLLGDKLYHRANNLNIVANEEPVENIRKEYEISYEMKDDLGASHFLR